MVPRTHYLYTPAAYGGLPSFIRPGYYMRKTRQPMKIHRFQCAGATICCKHMALFYAGCRSLQLNWSPSSFGEQ